MHSRLVVSVAFAMATVAPVMSIPAPVRQARDVQDPPPQDMEIFHPNPPYSPGTDRFMGLGPVELQQSWMRDNPPPGLSILKRSSSDTDFFDEALAPTDYTRAINDDTLNAKRDIPSGTTIEERGFLSSFLNNGVVKDFSDAASFLQMVPVMDAPKGL